MRYAVRCGRQGLYEPARHQAVDDVLVPHIFEESGIGMRKLLLAMLLTLAAVPAEARSHKVSTPAAPVAPTAEPATTIAAASSSGQNADIVAVVNDQAVSSYDVANRIKFIVATAKLSNSPDMVARIRPQVIRSL